MNDILYLDDIREVKLKKLVRIALIIFNIEELD